MGKCDKCGGHVVPFNDAVLITCVYQKGEIDFFVSFMHGSRHFFPTERCEGSPSRAQYIEGMPRDERGYPYIEEYELKWRNALKVVLEQFGGVLIREKLQTHLEGLGLQVSLPEVEPVKMSVYFPEERQVVDLVLNDEVWKLAEKGEGSET